MAHTKNVIVLLNVSVGVLCWISRCDANVTTEEPRPLRKTPNSAMRMGTMLAIAMSVGFAWFCLVLLASSVDNWFRSCQKLLCCLCHPVSSGGCTSNRRQDSVDSEDLDMSYDSIERPNPYPGRGSVGFNTEPMIAPAVPLYQRLPLDEASPGCPSHSAAVHERTSRASQYSGESMTSLDYPLPLEQLLTSSTERHSSSTLTLSHYSSGGSCLSYEDPVMPRSDLDLQTPDEGPVWRLMP